jgi:hypothetical protein
VHLGAMIGLLSLLRLKYQIGEYRFTEANH